MASWRSAFRSAVATTTVLVVLLVWTILAIQFGFAMGQQSILKRFMPQTERPTHTIIFDDRSISDGRESS